ncbi:YiiX/YebB-like N1pC/P60 family cysteine hydrolase [Roseivivax sp. CAU 1753]
MDSILSRTGRAMAGWLAERQPGTDYATPPNFETLHQTLRPGDVLLVEGQAHISTAIKYLTQSTWSHAALYTGSIPGHEAPDGTPHELVEAVVEAGCISVPLAKYAHHHTRICRPVGLNSVERQQVVDFMIDRIGLSYDMRNIIDLLRYFIPTPPVPTPWRRRMLSLGSGDPTRAICSSLIAQAFQSVKYPILPRIEVSGQSNAAREILHIRHHSLFAPRDFDISPYFDIIKPSIARGFNPHGVEWAARDAETA